jgi:hypothetical protein
MGRTVAATVVLVMGRAVVATVVEAMGRAVVATLVEAGLEDVAPFVDLIVADCDVLDCVLVSTDVARLVLGDGLAVLALVVVGFIVVTILVVVAHGFETVVGFLVVSIALLVEGFVVVPLGFVTSAVELATVGEDARVVELTFVVAIFVVVRDVAVVKKVGLIVDETCERSVPRMSVRVIYRNVEFSSKRPLSVTLMVT